MNASLFYRNLQSFFALFLLDTSLPSNYRTIKIIQMEALSSSVMETFLESAPQSILQCSIILRTGSMCKLILVVPKKYFHSTFGLKFKLSIELSLGYFLFLKYRIFVIAAGINLLHILSNFQFCFTL
jgi:hypothetical protein